MFPWFREKKLIGKTIAQKVVRKGEGILVAELFLWVNEYESKDMWNIQALLKAKFKTFLRWKKKKNLFIRSGIH